MATPPYIPSFYFSKFAQGISEPYAATSAYQAGAIDANGNFIKPESSIDPLEYLIIKLKKIFEELPMGMTKAQLNNYMSTMQLFGEEAKHFGITDSEFMGLMEANLALNGNTNISYIELSEDMGAAGMASAGTSPSYNTGSVSGYDPAMGTTRREQPVLKGLDSCEMFDVCPEEMRAFKSAKAWKHVPDSDTKRYLQRYQRRNPKGHMALRSMNPDTGESDLYWISFKPLSFMEECELNNLALVENTERAMKDVVGLGADVLINPQKIDVSGSGKLKRGAFLQRVGTLFGGIHNLLQEPTNPIKVASSTMLAYGRPVDEQGPDTELYVPETDELVAADVKGENTTPFSWLPKSANIKGFEKVEKLLQNPSAGKQKIKDTAAKISPENYPTLTGILKKSLSKTPWLIVPSASAKGKFNFPGLLTVVPQKNIEAYSDSVWKDLISPKLDVRFPKKGPEIRVRGRDIGSAEVAPILSKDATYRGDRELMDAMEKHLSTKTYRQLMNRIRGVRDRSNQS
jgi:hypothetical protein